MKNFQSRKTFKKRPALLDAFKPLSSIDDLHIHALLSPSTKESKYYTFKGRETNCASPAQQTSRYHSITDKLDSLIVKDCEIENAVEFRNMHQLSRIELKFLHKVIIYCYRIMRHLFKPLMNNSRLFIDSIQLAGSLLFLLSDSLVVSWINQNCNKTESFNLTDIDLKGINVNSSIAIVFYFSSLSNLSS